MTFWTLNSFMTYHSSTHALPRKSTPATPAVNLFATNAMNPKTGYGRMELGLMRGLLRIGAQVALTNTRVKPLHPVTIVVGSPEWCEAIPGRKWCYTMSESTRVSPEWVEALNQQCERVLVPCPPLVEIYEQSGVNVPVEYVPLGMDWRPAPYSERPANPDVFRWLTYSLGDMRKGADLAIMAFKRVFDGNPRHKLVIKCRDDAQWLTGLVDEQIELVQGEMSDTDMNRLLASCHAMIFASRGEGFGYPPREAVLSGMPVMATEALGMWDAAQWGYPISVKEMRPCQMDFWEANAEGSQWWEPEPSAIDAQLCAIMADYPAALAKAKAGREYLLANFTWEQTARQIIDLLKS